MEKSPFKFLEPYNEEDSNIYFGRDNDLVSLLFLIHISNFIVLYGPSGSGKTSLLRAGLSTKIHSDSVKRIYIRFAAESLEQTLLKELNKALKSDYRNVTSVKDGFEKLNKQYFKPVYIIIDQFEEVLKRANSKEELFSFFELVSEVLSKGYKMKIILSLRDDYFGRLYPFETVLPQIFENKHEIEKINRKNINTVIEKTFRAFGIESNSEAIDLISNNLDNAKIGHQLSYLQVYLDTIWKKALESNNGTRITEDIIKDSGKVEEVLSNYFLDSEKLILSKIKSSLSEELAREFNDWKNEFYIKLVNNDGTKNIIHKSDSGLFDHGSDLRAAKNSFLNQLLEYRLINEDEKYISIAHDSLVEVLITTIDKTTLRIKELKTKVNESIKDGNIDKKWLTVNFENLSKESNLHDEFSEDELNHIQNIKQELVKERKIKERKKRNIGYIILIGVLALLGGLLALAIYRFESHKLSNRLTAATNFIDNTRGSFADGIINKESLTSLKWDLLDKDRIDDAAVTHIIDLISNDDLTDSVNQEFESYLKEYYQITRAINDNNVGDGLEKLRELKKKYKSKSSKAFQSSIVKYTVILGEKRAHDIVYKYFFGNLNDNIKNFDSDKLIGREKLFYMKAYKMHDSLYLKYPNIEIMNMQDQGLTILDSTTWNLRKLNLLNLSHNRISFIDFNNIDSSKVSIIFLNDNSLISFPEEFSVLEKLESLNLSDNYINQIEFKKSTYDGFQRLRFLNLANNPLKYFPLDLLQLTNLYSLRLDNCNIQELPSNFYDVLNNKSNLKTLHFHHNPKVRIDVTKLKRPDLKVYQDNKKQ